MSQLILLVRNHRLGPRELTLISDRILELEPDLVAVPDSVKERSFVLSHIHGDTRFTYYQEEFDYDYFYHPFLD